MKTWVLATSIDVGRKLMENPVTSTIGAVILYAISTLYGSSDIVRAGITVIFFQIVIDWIVGTSASKKDNIDTSQYGIEGIKRSIVILLLPALANFLDTFLFTQGLIVYFTLAGLSRSIMKSIIANLYRTGWTAWIPVTMLDKMVNWVKDEIVQKETRANNRRKEIGQNERRHQRVGQK